MAWTHPCSCSPPMTRRHFLSQATSLQQLARSQNSTMRRTEIARLALAQAQAQLKQQEASAAEQVKAIADQRAQINSAVTEQQQILSQLQEEQRKQLAAIAAQKRAAAAAAAAKARRDAAARAARAQREAAASANSGGSGNSGSGGGGGGNGGGGGGGGYSSGRAAIAVQYALSQVGDPYSYNANPPSSWDCSKLTSAAWGRAGVSLTAYSYAQASETRRVSTGDLQPGDILFYFNGAHHVAMYIGGGQLVEASSPSTGVRVTSLWNSWSARHFSFAGRPVG